MFHGLMKTSLVRGDTNALNTTRMAFKALMSLNIIIIKGETIIYLWKILMLFCCCCFFKKMTVIFVFSTNQTVHTALLN